MDASLLGPIDVVNALISAKADVNARDIDGRPAIGVSVHQLRVTL